MIKDSLPRAMMKPATDATKAAARKSRKSAPGKKCSLVATNSLSQTGSDLVALINEIDPNIDVRIYQIVAAGNGSVGDEMFIEDKTLAKAFYGEERMNNLRPVISKYLGKDESIYGKEIWHRNGSVEDSTGNKMSRLISISLAISILSNSRTLKNRRKEMEDMNMEDRNKLRQTADKVVLKRAVAELTTSINQAVGGNLQGHQVAMIVNAAFSFNKDLSGIKNCSNDDDDVRTQVLEEVSILYNMTKKRSPEVNILIPRKKKK